MCGGRLRACTCLQGGKCGGQAAACLGACVITIQNNNHSTIPHHKYTLLRQVLYNNDNKNANSNFTTGTNDNIMNE